MFQGPKLQLKNYENEKKAGERAGSIPIPSSSAADVTAGSVNPARPSSLEWRPAARSTVQ